MGFMDKAKKLAEQAQQKLDEAQTQFNQNAAPQADPQQGAVQYDAHGRPIEQAPQVNTNAPSAASAPSAPTSEPAAPTPDPAAPSPEEEASPPSPPPSASGGANASPDPFKPL
jgi:hypothetical protein